MRLLHVSLTARNAGKLSSFYKTVFGFVERRAPKRLSGAAVSRGNGLPDNDIYSTWLNLPSDNEPFLEIMEYAETVDRGLPAVNEPGFGHLAFEVSDLYQTIDEVRRCGGDLQGQVTNFGTEERPHLIVYARDNEGNILELEQSSITESSL
ncbi:MAG: VOC family protein [Epibacterium sp.]|nr:VOC family protein [Epibacterium sp.]NQX75042.1 VOC family protein [Epibacterium sp.]